MGKKSLYFKWISDILLHFNWYSKPIFCLKSLKYQRKHLLLPSHHHMIYTNISWVIDKRWSMYESPGLNSDWFLRYQVVFNKERKHWIIKQPLQNLPRKRKVRDWSVILCWLFIIFFFVYWKNTILEDKTSGSSNWFTIIF